MTELSIQDHYLDDVAHCYGCGRLNEHGLHVRSFVEGDETVCRFRPRPYHTAVPGFVYGGLVASLIDCHATGTASAAAYRAEGRAIGTEPPRRFVTASLHIDFLRPTPIDAELELRARVAELRGRKVIVAVTLSATGQVCAKGEVVCVEMPKGFGRPV